MSTQVDIHLQGVEDVLSYQFNDRNILWEALQAASSRVVSIGGRVLTDGNKRLAMLGDAIVNVALIEEWYASGQSKGKALQWTFMRSSLIQYKEKLRRSSRLFAPTQTSIGLLACTDSTSSSIRIHHRVASYLRM